MVFVSTSNELRRVSLDDGTVTALATIPLQGDVFWGIDGSIYGASPVVCAWAIPATGGERSPLFGGACSGIAMAPVSNLALEPANWAEHDQSLIVKVHRPDGTRRRGVIVWRDGIAALDTTQEPFDNASADGSRRCRGGDAASRQSAVL
jgi:hypothetical protein